MQMHVFQKSSQPCTRRTVRRVISLLENMQRQQKAGCHATVPMETGSGANRRVLLPAAAHALRFVTLKSYLGCMGRASS